MIKDINKINYKKLGYFRYAEMNGKMLLTNDVGEYVFLEKKDFSNFLHGNIKKGHKLHKELVDKGFWGGEKENVRMIQKIQRKKSFLNQGPSLHIFVVTLRCNHQCVYCHASARGEGSRGFDMSKETARKSLNIVFQCPNKDIIIEFQGGEPLINWPVVKYIIEEAKKRAKKTKKNVDIRLVSNFTLMTDERFDYLLKNKTSLCTSLDGHEKVHNANRPAKINGYKLITKWIDKFNQVYPKIQKQGYIWKISAITTISRYSLKYPKEIIDEYIRQGAPSIFIRPLDPFGFSKNAWSKIGYTTDEYLKFYNSALDYILKLNEKGINFQERMAKMFLIKILTPNDPNMMDYRNPCGAAIGQLAYNYNGDVYTCDEGRMLSRMGDENFRLGNVYKNSYKEIVSCPVSRSMCSASCLEYLPGCADCVFNPYCGVCPIYNYFEQGNIFGQMPTNERCQINKSILKMLFLKMQNKKYREIFIKWTKN